MIGYTDFIPQNIAGPQVEKIGVYNKQGKQIGHVPLRTLAFPVGEKQYSFGALSDIHLMYDTAQEDFQRALIYLNQTEQVDFTCVCGDLSSTGAPEELEIYTQHIDSYAGEMPVYAIAGNHEGVNSDIANVIQQYTRQPLYYAFTRGDDVFIMVGNNGNYPGRLFANGCLQWLYETLEENRNKRCFLFQHIRPNVGCGNAFGLYESTTWGDTQSKPEATVFESLLRHYPNIIFFHGHSHLKFYLQYGADDANYDHIYGCHSVHIPALAVLRDGNESGPASMKPDYSGSEGYVVDVYQNGVHLRGRDFVNGKFLPIASYWLDTTLKTVEAGTYSDPTGMIVT